MVGKFFGILLLTYLSFIGINQMQTVSETKITSENEMIETIKNTANPIVCILKANKRKHRIGERPDIAIEIINRMNSTITLVGSLDGSDDAKRLSVSRFTIQHQMLGYKARSYYRCFRTNRFRAADFKEVKTGASFNPYEEIDDHGFFSDNLLNGNSFLLPGIYTLTYYYSTNPKDIYSYTENAEIVDSSYGVPNEALLLDNTFYEYNRVSNQS